MHLKKSYDPSELPPGDRPVGERGVDAEELLVEGGVVDGVLYGGRSSAVVRRGRVVSPLLTVRRVSRPPPTGLAGEDLHPHHGVALVAGVGGPVLEVSAGQTDLPVVRVSQFWTLSLWSDAGQATQSVTQTQLLLVVTVPVLGTLLHTRLTRRRHRELVPGRAELLPLHVPGDLQLGGEGVEGEEYCERQQHDDCLSPLSIRI